MYLFRESLSPAQTGKSTIRKTPKTNLGYIRKRQNLFGRKHDGVRQMKKTYGYARVSTREQNLGRQIKALRDAGVDDRDIITDKASGKSLEREGYHTMMLLLFWYCFHKRIRI